MNQLIGERRLIIPSDLNQVPEVCSFVVEAAEGAGLDERAVYHCQMAVDEWCTNVIEHGFQKYGKRGWIEVVCGVQIRQFKITISDDSPAFDPTLLADVDPSLPLEERQPGGLGWFFIRKIMDQVTYSYKDGRNHLTMVKNNDQPQNVSQPANPFPVHQHQEGIWIMAPSGRLDSTNGRQLETALSAELAVGHIRLIIDLSSVSYMSSSGLKVLLTARKQAVKQGGMVVLCSLSARVREIFDISGFDTLFTIMATVDEAAAAIAAQ